VVLNSQHASDYYMKDKQALYCLAIHTTVAVQARVVQGVEPAATALMGSHSLAHPP
jgi:hypothetical protein